MTDWVADRIGSEFHAAPPGWLAAYRGTEEQRARSALVAGFLIGPSDALGGGPKPIGTVVVCDPDTGLLYEASDYGPLDGVFVPSSADEYEEAFNGIWSAVREIADEVKKLRKQDASEG